MGRGNIPMKDPRGDRSSLDSFWDLSDLVPSARHPAKRAAFADPVTPQTVDATPAPTTPRAPEERRLPFAPSATEQISEYRPEDNCLIETVRIHARRENYPFYGRFRRDAERYLPMKGRECPYVPFFSYIPQYSQLKTDQLAYYLYFRDCVNRGEYPRADESYFYLYVYEIINLPDKIPPVEGVLRLARVWGAYRGAFPRVDKYMAEWLCDYCLVHGLPSPEAVLRPFRAKILPHATLREFYLGEMGKMTLGGVDTALAFFSDYRFRDSRYAQGDGAAAFERDILSALAPVLSSVFSDRERLLAGAKPTTFTRDAFCGSLCAHQVRSRIEVTYYAIPDAAPLRALLTNAVKYAENRIRIRMSVKSRLAVRELAPEYRRMIDEYFLTGAGQRKENGRTSPAFAAPLSFAVDPRAAAAIESDSWETTRRLVLEEPLDTPAAEPRTFSAPTPEKAPTPPSALPEETEKTEIYFAADFEMAQETKKNGSAALSAAATEYLCHLLGGDLPAARRAAAASGRMEEELAEEINEYSMNELGDIAIEMGVDGYAIIPDYLDEVQTWTK